ncbi:MAG TPA: hypothetical protein VI160_06690, partial [Gemmatimonadales bacterium]
MITDGLTPLAVLAFLALVGGVLAAGVAVLAALLMKRPLWARRVALAGDRALREAPEAGRRAYRRLA